MASPFEALNCHIPETRKEKESIINPDTSIIHDNYCNTVNSFLTDTSIRRTPRVDPRLFSQLLFQSLSDAHRRRLIAGLNGVLLKLHANGRNNSQHCWSNNIGSCCVPLHVAKRMTSFKLLRNNSQQHATAYASGRNM